MKQNYLNLKKKNASLNKVSGYTQYSLIFKHPTRANFLCCCMYMYSGLKISVSDACDKMSGVFGLGSDIFKMMSAGGPWI